MKVHNGSVPCSESARPRKLRDQPDGVEQGPSIKVKRPMGNRRDGPHGTRGVQPAKPSNNCLQLLETHGRECPESHSSEDAVATFQRPCDKTFLDGCCQTLSPRLGSEQTGNKPC
ncbi:hypothetical protein SKAU_G00401320 [Synaphobranchus kaupii]|uniref:Uncharacterized protein n=1 Tax=Synaphobranchus kaupii TaxID=118154 RepID=A0A9Q1E964_SYNKA|nr:hypothetical protein SKAU_G00401320 [Synaphobranchus kaupii]